MQQHELLQKFQGRTENYVPTLEVALRRAAAFGLPADIRALLALGANIDSQSPSTNSTALLIAVKREQAENARCLLEQRADRKLPDDRGNLPAFYASQSSNITLKELFRDRSPQALQSAEMLVNIFEYLPSSQIFKNRRVSSFWRGCTAIAINRYLFTCGFTNEDAAFKHFYELPIYLQQGILSYLISQPATGREKVKRLLEGLLLSTAERDTEFFPELPRYSQNRGSFSHLTDEGLALFILEPIPRAAILNKRDTLCTPTGILLLLEGFLTEEKLALFRHSGSSRGPFDNLKALICYYGYQALKKGFLTVEDAAHISELALLLSENGLKALQKEWLTPLQARGIYHSGSASGPYSNMRHLLSDKGLLLLENQIITGEQAAYITTWDALTNEVSLGLIQTFKISFSAYPGKAICSIEPLIRNLTAAADLLMGGYLTPSQLNILGQTITKYDGWREAFNTRFIDAQEIMDAFFPNGKASKLSSNLNYLMTPNGMLALDRQLLTVEEASKIIDLKNLLSDNGLQALEEGLVSIEDAKQCQSLRILTQANGLEMLRKRWITPKQADAFRSDASLSLLLSPIGLQAIADKLITPEQAARFYHSGQICGSQDNLKDLLTPTGLAALQDCTKLGHVQSTTNSARQKRYWHSFKEKELVMIVKNSGKQLGLHHRLV